MIAGVAMVSFWFFISDFYFFVNSQGPDDEDNLRLKDAKSGLIRERVFWAFTYQVHGYHMSAL
jgi:hypothetical protein